MTAAHFAQMKDNIRGTMPKIGIEAVVASMEGSGEITLEDRVKGRGAKPRTTWRKEAAEWARKRGWPTVNPAGGGGSRKRVCHTRMWQWNWVQDGRVQQRD